MVPTGCAESLTKGAPPSQRTLRRPPLVLVSKRLAMASIPSASSEKKTKWKKRKRRAVATGKYNDLNEPAAAKQSKAIFSRSLYLISISNRNRRHDLCLYDYKSFAAAADGSAKVANFSVAGAEQEQLASCIMEEGRQPPHGWQPMIVHASCAAVPANNTHGLVGNPANESLYRY